MVSPSSLPHAELRDIEQPLDDYRPVSALAIAGLLLGLCSVVALIHPVLWLVPLSGVLLSLWALRRMAVASPPLLGRKAALVGITLSLIFGISAPIQHWAHRRALRAQAIELADEWFTALRENRPDYALRLTRHPTTKAERSRPPSVEHSRDEDPLSPLRKDTQEQPQELLLKLGKTARVRLFRHEAVWRDEASEGTRDAYVVTVGKGDEAVSFFVRIGCLRSQNRATGEWQWQVTKHDFLGYPDPELLDALD